MAQWIRAPLPPQTRVRFPYSPSHVSWVCFWFSSFSEGFSRSTVVVIVPVVVVLVVGNSCSSSSSSSS